MNRALAVTSVVLLLLSATGCVFIPIPTKHYDSGHARTNINQHAQEQFAPGKSTREDVVMALGEPDAVSWDERELAYRSEKVVALWILAAGGGYSGVVTGGNIYKNRFYVFEFDSQGLYQTNRQTGQYGLVQGADEPQWKSPAFKSGGSNGVPAMVAGELVRHEYPKSFWLAGVDGYRSRGSTSIMGQPGRLLLTESNLAFVTESQFANTEPALKLPLASVVEVRMDKWVLARRLVIRLDTNKTHSFLIVKPGSVWQDKTAMQDACDFIQSKIKPTQPEK